ncbi:HNH endonuclease [Roseburia faecis]|uniref:HNH endonuclease n=1 Tax=Roseburia faecis TaxID=301302 RepID=UPI003F95CDA8
MAIAEIGKVMLETVKQTGEKVAETAKEIIGKGDSIFPDFFKDLKSEIKQNTFCDLDSMKKELEKTYAEIKEDKPPNSPNIAKWFDNGGSIKIEEVDGKKVWTYIDDIGRQVKYVDGYPVFPPEAKHPVIDDINIGKFTGDRSEDKKIYLEKLEEQYGLTEIPDGYALHHDFKNGNMQLVKTDWHKEFTHAGGHSLFKEG